MSNQAVLPVPGQDQRVRCAPLTRAPIGEGEAAGVAHVLKALADPVRLRLLSLIGAHEGGEPCVCDLTAAFDLTAPTISHHLKVLREAGLIQLATARDVDLLPRRPGGAGIPSRAVHP